VLLLAFAGWSDAGASATTAVRYLVDQLLAKKFAASIPRFYDFSAKAGGAFDGKQMREIHWPPMTFIGSGRRRKDFVLGVGAEPRLHWRTFTETMLRFVRNVTSR
jgi:hypothetical protein